LNYTFELFVAWRYLRERGSRAGLWTMLISVLFFVAAGVLYYLELSLSKVHPFELTDRQFFWKQVYQWGKLGALAVGVLVLVFGIFHSLQSIFTTISTYGVFLGTAALVIVLSVMNGFEADLRQKILGSNAHILVSREDGPLTEYRGRREEARRPVRPAWSVRRRPHALSLVGGRDRRELQLRHGHRQGHRPAHRRRGHRPRPKHLGRLPRRDVGRSGTGRQSPWSARARGPKRRQPAPKPAAPAPAPAPADDEPVDFSQGGPDAGVARPASLPSRAAPPQARPARRLARRDPGRTRAGQEPPSLRGPGGRGRLAHRPRHADRAGAPGPSLPTASPESSSPACTSTTPSSSTSPSRRCSSSFRSATR